MASSDAQHYYQIVRDELRLNIVSGRLPEGTLVFEAAVAEYHAWPAGSEEGVLVLAGFARFLAAHTPTRRELARVVDIATRLRRGEELFEAD